MDYKDFELPDYQQQLPTPITCPRCHSRELAFVAEYHKCIKERILSLISLFFLIIFGFQFINERYEFVIYLLIAGLVFLVVQIKILFDESKTHVQGICKNCGHLWLLN